LFNIGGAAAAADGGGRCVRDGRRRADDKDDILRIQLPASAAVLSRAEELVANDTGGRAEQ